MAATHVYAGAARSMGGTLGGIFRQEAGGGKWEQLKSGLADGAEVHAITVPPSDPDTVFVGSTKGLYRSTNRGGRFEKLALPGGDADIWSVLVHPKDPRRIYAGASPIAVYRSDDGGDHWKQTADPALPNRVHMAFACRVMRLDVDPNQVYGISRVGQVFGTTDGGKSWSESRLPEGVRDCYAIACG